MNTRVFYNTNMSHITFTFSYKCSVIADSASAEYCSTFTRPSVCVSVHRRDISPFHPL